MKVFVLCVTIYAVWENQDPVTYISVSQVAVSDQVSVRGKWKKKRKEEKNIYIYIYPFQSIATKINSF